MKGPAPVSQGEPGHGPKMGRRWPGCWAQRPRSEARTGPKVLGPRVLATDLACGRKGGGSIADGGGNALPFPGLSGQQGPHDRAGSDDCEARTMQALEHVEEFWSDTYRGRNIAILNRGGSWLVYLDHVMQHRMLFDTAESAVRWLRRQIDQSRTSRLY